MTRKEHQEKLNKKWARKRKGPGFKFYTKEESYNKFLEHIGDYTRKTMLVETVTEKWKKENKKT